MKQVLLIDDDPVSRRSVLAQLEQAGVTAMTASTAAEGLKLIYVHHSQIMCVLLDIGLPDGSGFKVARAIRADPFMIDVRFAVITAYREPEIEKEAALLSIEHILYKPVSIAQITALVERYQNNE
jgi:CheY-like chemotaxis protein